MRRQGANPVFFCTAAFYGLCQHAHTAYDSLTGWHYPDDVFFEGQFVAQALSLSIVNDPVAPRAAALLLVLVLITFLMGAVPG
jgi:hypothetical protein